MHMNMNIISTSKRNFHNFHLKYKCENCHHRQLIYVSIFKSEFRLKFSTVIIHSLCSVFVCALYLFGFSFLICFWMTSQQKKHSKDINYFETAEIWCHGYLCTVEREFYQWVTALKCEFCATSKFRKESSVIWMNDVDVESSTMTTKMMMMMAKMKMMIISAMCRYAYKGIKMWTNERAITNDSISDIYVLVRMVYGLYNTHSHIKRISTSGYSFIMSIVMYSLRDNKSFSKLVMDLIFGIWAILFSIIISSCGEGECGWVWVKTLMAALLTYTLCGAFAWSVVCACSRARPIIFISFSPTPM